MKIILPNHTITCRCDYVWSKRSNVFWKECLQWLPNDLKTCNKEVQRKNGSGWISFVKILMRLFVHMYSRKSDFLILFWCILFRSKYLIFDVNEKLNTTNLKISWLKNDTHFQSHIKQNISSTNLFHTLLHCNLAFIW